MARKWVETLVFLGAHGGGTIRGIHTSYPTDPTFEVWMDRAKGRPLGELCDLLVQAGFLDRETLLHSLPLPWPVVGGIHAAIENQIERDFQGHARAENWRAIFDRLDTFYGDLVRSYLGEEIRDAWARATRRAQRREPPPLEWGRPRPHFELHRARGSRTRHHRGRLR